MKIKIGCDIEDNPVYAGEEYLVMVRRIPVNEFTSSKLDGFYLVSGKFIISDFKVKFVMNTDQIIALRELGRKERVMRNIEPASRNYAKCIYPMRDEYRDKLPYKIKGYKLGTWKYDIGMLKKPEKETVTIQVRRYA